MLSRFYYHMLVVIWLGILCLIDWIANSLLTGIMSDVYYYKVFLDAGLIWWTVLYLREDVNGSVVASANRTATLGRRAEESVLQVDLGAAEYIYYGFLFAYGFGNLYFHHLINNRALGLLATGTMLMSLVDVAVAVVGAVNFWHVASGKFVKLQRQVSGQS